jgi:hypothetical protein
MLGQYCLQPRSLRQAQVLMANMTTLQVFVRVVDKIVIWVHIPSEQQLAACSHCWFQRQFEATSEVFGGRQSDAWYCSAAVDPSILDYWESVWYILGPTTGNYTDMSNGVYRGTLDQLIGTLGDQNTGVWTENSAQHDFGTVEFDPTSLDHWVDWWGAAAYTYGMDHSDGGTPYHQWSDAGFRADIRVDIK